MQENYNINPNGESSSNGIWAVIAVIAILVIGYLLFANARRDDTPDEQNNTTIEENTTNEVTPPTDTDTTPEPAPAPAPTPTP